MLKARRMPWTSKVFRSPFLCQCPSFLFPIPKPNCSMVVVSVLNPGETHGPGWPIPEHLPM